jgi:nucleotide-binding universal stress UspA family protein
MLGAYAQLLICAATGTSETLRHSNLICGRKKVRTAQHLVMERQDERAATIQPRAPGIHTILLHILDDEFHDQRIDNGLALARACSAHLSCLHVTPIEAYVASDTLGGIFVMSDVMRKLDERDYELRNKVELRLAKEDVSWDYEQVTGNVASVIVGRAALADLLVTARQPRQADFVAPTVGFIGDLLQRARTPLFIPAFNGPNFDPAGTAVIAWDGSIEAANAVRASLGLLKLASAVRVLQIPEQRDDERKSFPGTKVLEYLSRQGVHAELTVEQSPSERAGPDVVAGMLVAQARGAGAAYIVMGGYSHSRIGEHVFGGVTRMLLKECPLPLVIAH